MRLKAILVAAMIVGAARAGAQASAEPRDSILSADTILVDEVGVDIAPRGIINGRPAVSMGDLGASMVVPKDWRIIDALPPEGPLPGEPVNGRGTGRVSVLWMDGARKNIVAPAIVATGPTVAFIRPVLGRYRLGPEDTVVESSRPIKPGTLLRYAYVARPGDIISGAWAMEGKNAKWLPASGTYRFTRRTVIVPILEGEIESSLNGEGGVYSAPFIPDPVRPVAKRPVKKMVKKKVQKRAGGAKAKSQKRAKKSGAKAGEK